MKKAKILLELKKRRMGTKEMLKEVSQRERAGFYDDGTDGTRSDFEKRYHYMRGLLVAEDSMWEWILTEGRKGCNIIKADRYFEEKIKSL